MRRCSESMLHSLSSPSLFTRTRTGSQASLVCEPLFRTANVMVEAAEMALAIHEELGDEAGRDLATEALARLRDKTENEG